MSHGWIGVDLDGTLAHYDGWNGGAIGEPVMLMLGRVRHWLAEGTRVKIVTARVGRDTGYSEESGREDDARFEEEQRALIADWCIRHLGRPLEVTASKDFAMIELWDDRCVRVEANTGRVIGDPL